jgi:uncharacterized protein (DUF4415 family)
MREDVFTGSGRRIAMKGKITRTTASSRTEGKTDFKRLRRMRDADIKRAGSGYQTRINAILRSYMKAQSE